MENNEIDENLDFQLFLTRHDCYDDFRATYSAIEPILSDTIRVYYHLKTFLK